MTVIASAPAPASATAGRSASHAVWGSREVVQLQQVRGFPAVSVLMATTPGPSMTLTDQTRLEDMVDQATLRLQRLPDGDPAPLVKSLLGLTRTLATQPTGHGFALFASAGVARSCRLPVPPIDRVVIDHTFATRDLVLALQRTPRHVVLVVSAHDARLFESSGGTLDPAPTPAFPLRRSRPRRSNPDRPALRQADTEEFLRTVDRRLTTYRALHPSPLVLVGTDPLLKAFTRQARRLDRLAGTLTRDHLKASLAELSAATRPVLQRYLASREQDALELVWTRAAQGRVAAGMQAAWLASRTTQPEMLAVEESLFYPARLSPDGHTIELSPDIDQPDVIDDAVDELIEHVLIRGGWIAIVGDRALDRYGGVALVSRR